MAEQAGDVAEQLRRMGWELRTSRDQLLKAAEGRPPWLLERAQETAEMLMDYHRQIQKISARLPADADAAVPAGLGEEVAGLHRKLEHILWDLDLLIKDLHEIFEETPVLKTN